ncbi:MAG TPA: helix-turn-helix domain-containing protein [Actinomycetota bacterium]
MHPVTAVRSRPQVTSAIGIGRALRQARLLRRKSLEEASRETHIRRQALSALEREEFDALGADVYARGALRTYSSYLGLNADRVLKLYAERFGPPRGSLPEPVAAPATGALEPVEHPMLFRAAPTWAFLTAVALLVLAVLATLGVLSW